MKKILILLLFLLIIITGCGEKEIPVKIEENPGKVITYIYSIDDIELEEEEIVEEDIVTVRLCHDTDNGIVRWINGSIFGYYQDSSRFELNDECLNNNKLIEYYCEDERPQNRSFICKNTCRDNHCL